MGHRCKAATIGLVALVLLVGATVVARLALEPEARQQTRIRNPAWLPNGRALRLFSVGQRLTLADFYWLRVVQYVGESVQARTNRWEALYPLADITTDLDPRFGYAYQIAGSNLSGLAQRYAEADRILLKGMRNVPDRWSLPFVYAVNKFFYQGDYNEAAIYARRAAEVGQRPHLALLAANLSLATDREEEYRVAADFLQESLSQADTPELKAQLEQRLIKVETYAVLLQIERAIDTYQKRMHSIPVALEQLVANRLLTEVPVDPSGGQIVYSPLTGEVRSTVLGARRPLKTTHQ